MRSKEETESGRGGEGGRERYKECEERACMLKEKSYSIIILCIQELQYAPLPSRPTSTRSKEL